MSIENLVKYIEAITLLLPLVQQVVDMIEAAFKNSARFDGRSEMKKNIAVEVVSMAAGNLPINGELIPKLIDTVVAVENASGQFKHSG